MKIREKLFVLINVLKFFREESWLWIPGNLKWLWRCRVREYWMKLLAILSGMMSALVIWSECTFWARETTLSVFALLVQYWSRVHNYFNMELFCFISISYLCFCAYWTLFQIKVSLRKKGVHRKLDIN